MTLDRSSFVSLEKPIHYIGKELKSAHASVAVQHKTILAAAKRLQKEYALILKTFYASPPKVKGGAFGKLVAIWSEDQDNIPSVTKDDLKTVENSLGNNVKFPPSYRSAVLKYGLPTFSDEFVARLQDIKVLDALPPIVDGDWSVETENYISIKRFLTPAQIIEKTMLISEKTKNPPTSIAIAEDENGCLLCYKDCVKPAPNDPPHYGEPDLIYDPANNKKIKDSILEGEFGDWIENYLLIKPLNLKEESITDLKTPIENMSEIATELLNSEEYLENTRYHKTFSVLNEHITDLSKLYFQTF